MPKKPETVTKSDKPNVKRFNLNDWLGISNLVLTAFVGIYLALRNESLQKNIVNWQKQAELATVALSVSDEVSENVTVSLTNTGPSVAKNLRISVCLSYVSPIWQDVIQNINQIDFRYKNQSVGKSEEISYTHCGVLKTSDSKIISIPNLPPNGSFVFDVFTDNNALTKIQSEKITVSSLIDVNKLFPNSDEIRVSTDPAGPGELTFTKDGILWKRSTTTAITVENIIISTKNEQIKINLPDLFSQSINKVSLAFIVISASCENCILQNDVISTNIPSVIKWNSSTLSDITLVKLKDQKSGIVFTTSASIDALAPKDFNGHIIESPYFILDMSDGVPTLVNVGQIEFENYKKP